MKQETLIYFWFATLGVLTLLLVALSWRFVMPATPRLYVGVIAEFPPGQPQLRNLTSDLAVYVVNRNEALWAWDATPAMPQPCARYQWVAANNRFEDPCSGGKWCIDGSIAEVRLLDAHTLTRYELDIDINGEVYLLPWRKIVGAPLAAEWRRSHAVDWLPPDTIYYCQQVLK